MSLSKYFANQLRMSVALRSFDRSDSAALQRILNDRSLWSDMLPLFPVPCSPDAVARFLAERAAEVCTVLLWSPLSVWGHVVAHLTSNVFYD
jgi:hypothetical protein